MLIGKALLLKGLGGLAALAGTIGGGYSLYDYLSNQETRFDRGLIEFLEADDSTNIQFSVKDGNDANISDSFPQFTTSDTTPTATVTIKVSVNATTGGTTDGTLTDATDSTLEKGQKSYLQNLNKGSGNTGNDWTWECKIVFKKTETATGTELKDKEKLVQSSEPKGFFDKLKDTDASNKHKKLKIKFIKDCAAAREIEENRKINKLETLTSTSNPSNKIESTKEFELIDNTEATKKLIPKNQSDFDHWFKNEGN